ncbi:Shedu anti-phage system protein SduA domain-containing protein [Actinosynnema sp. NPDC020468]|uniref:Shedu immune nuclease family protein n=1 Tax=Actinosynnema sp. NPDC020468 TaxID=3154488 RepID=UPI0033FD31D6
MAAEVRRRVFLESGGICNFPDCDQRQWDEETLPLLQLAHIYALGSDGPRSPSDHSAGGSDELSNLLLLCPTHHALVDRYPEKFSPEVLIGFKENSRRRQVEQPVQAKKSPLAMVLEAWQANQGNSVEEFWQKLFTDFPVCLLPSLGGRSYRLQSKCFVGGRGWDTGGSELDFLVVYGANVACVEIKTPTTRLMAKSKYRGNVYSPSRELAGAVVQVLESRHSLMREIAHINANSESLRHVNPVGPACFVIIGNQEREGLSPTQRRSFELFRTGLRDVTILTFDEVFSGIAALLEATLDHGGGSPSAR